MKGMKAIRKFFSIIAAFFLIATCLFSSVVTQQAYADNINVKNYSETDILDDLSDVDVLLYPKNEFGKLEVIRFQEYCYSEKHFFAEYYGLFVYIYNPTEKPIKIDGKHSINIADAYDSKGEPSSFTKATLNYCDKTDNNRFYKFEISNSVQFLSMAKGYAESHEGTRRYDLVEIELIAADETKIQSYDYSKTYYFSGLAAGCGETTESESTLSCTKEGLTTIGLDVFHTNYRTGDYVDYVCDELNTVYFAVPTEYFEEYGGLQKIKAEWYEYKTKPIFVTSDSTGYSTLEKYIGSDIGEKNTDLGYRVLWEEERTVVPGTIVIDYTWDNRYNAKVGEYAGGVSENFSNQYVSRMDWLFERKDVTSVEEYKVTAQEIKTYMSWYTSKYGGTLLNGYSAALFSDSIDKNRIALLEDSANGATRGYIKKEFDADKDTQDLLVQKDLKWWQELSGVKYEEKSIEPIIVLNSTIKDLSADEFSEKYMVNPSEAAKVQSDCISMLDAGKKPILFRFAVTDYYASTARFDSLSNAALSQQNGYVAQMSMFLDFDIISLTFRDVGGVETVIGVVSNPIDVINGVEPSPDLTVPPYWDWDWESLFDIIVDGILTVVSFIMAAVLVFVLVKILIAVFKGLIGKG